MSARARRRGFGFLFFFSLSSLSYRRGSGLRASSVSPGASFSMMMLQLLRRPISLSLPRRAMSRSEPMTKKQKRRGRRLGAREVCRGRGRSSGEMPTTTTTEPTSMEEASTAQKEKARENEPPRFPFAFLLDVGCACWLCRRQRLLAAVPERESETAREREQGKKQC